MKQNKVAVNLNQDFTEEEQTTARNNIRAASTDNIRTINGTLANLDSRVDGLEQQIQQDKFDIRQQLLKSYEGNTTVLDKNFISTLSISTDISFKVLSDE